MAGDRELKAMQTALAALQPLDAEARQRVLDWLAAKLGLEAPVPTGGGGASPAAAGGGKLGTVKQFLKLKAPSDDVGRVAALAYFLTHGDKLNSYKIEDLNKARIDAALAKLSMSSAVANAKRARYVTTTADHGTYQITSFGESLVDAMPDGAAVRKVKAEGRKRRRKSAGKKRATAKKTAAKKA
jgi:hypothetical protein